MPEKWTPQMEEAANEDFESHKPPEESEAASFYPELIANEPLTNTTLIYSVPVMGEWHNGNLLRFLRSVLAQRVERDEAFEVELLFNSGRLLEIMQKWDSDSKSMEVDANGNAVLDTKSYPEAATQLDSLMRESDQAIEFLRKIVDIQHISRTKTQDPQAENEAEKLKEMIDSESDLIRRQILQLASEKAESISISTLDLTRKSLQDTPYVATNLSSLRTLGADIAATRFNENPDLVLNLFDADTILASNDTVKQTQATFTQYPDLNYLFLNMTNAPVGVEQEFVADSPRASVIRTAAYGREVSHGSPQIAFRLRAYQKLKELSGWMDEGFTSHEDSDTAMRLAYHFGQIQDGLLFESGLEIPAVMTADRLDGAVDSVGRKMEYEQLGVQSIAEDIGHVYDLQNRIDVLVSKEAPDQQDKIQLSLQNARHHFKREQQVQQRFNRVVLKCFINAVQAGSISIEEDKLNCNDAQILQMRGGDALLHYVKSNSELIVDILSNIHSIDQLQACLDGVPLPNDEETPFYHAVREYIDEVRLVSDLVEEGLVTKPDPEIKKYFGIHEYKVWHPEDKRTSEDRVSFMHSMVAETFALTTIYKMHFEKDWAKNRRENWNSSLSSWPENPDDQNLEYHYPDLDSRLQSIQQSMSTKGRDVPSGSTPNDNPLSGYLHWKSVPMSKLLNRFRKLNNSKPT